jgi:hypothetical protein
MAQSTLAGCAISQRPRTLRHEPALLSKENINQIKIHPLPESPFLFVDALAPIGKLGAMTWSLHTRNRLPLPATHFARAGMTWFEIRTPGGGAGR